MPLVCCGTHIPTLRLQQRRAEDVFPRGVDEDVEEEEGVGEVSTVEKDGGVMGGEAGVREEQENHNHSHKVTAAWRLIVNLRHRFEFPSLLLENIPLFQCCQLSGLVASFSKYSDPSSKTKSALLGCGGGVLLETFGKSSSS